MNHQKHSEEFSSWKILFWIVFAFIVWLYCFRGFMTGFLKFESDAVGYYQHNKFFLDNMCRGVYPLWDPSINGGVPNEFFLRRLGSFNPFLLIVVFLRKIGLTHLIAYNIYLAVYFFLGSIGFYKLAKRIFNHTPSAYLAYLLFLFSSLGTRQFDSYIVLVSVPLIWFFYFLISFIQKPQRHSFLGIIFCLMNLVTTYIPLYFFIIGLSFVVISIFIYPREIIRSVSVSIAFMSKNKVLSIVGIIVFLSSLVPAIMIFKSAKNAEFVMPMRGSATDSSNALAVGKKTVTEWALLEEIVYTKAFTDLKKFKFAIIYFPGVIYLFLLLGCMARMNRKLLLLFIWGGFLFLLSVPGLSPVYEFLHQHVFFFKYFRNLHWFFWLAILPIFILFVVEQIRQILVLKCENHICRIGFIIFFVLIHVFFCIYAYVIGNTIITTYICACISLVFFMLLQFKVISIRSQWALLFITLFVSIQAIEVYGYLQMNASKRNGRAYKGDVAYEPMAFKHLEDPKLTQPQNLYYALRPYSEVFFNIDKKALFDYQNNKYLLFNQIEHLNLSDDKFVKIETMYKTRNNLAYVSGDINFLGDRGGSRYQVVKEDTPAFRIKKATVDAFTIETDFDQPKFLVINNVFHRYWKANLNGHKHKIIPTNLAFQGLILPKGKNVLRMQFGSTLYRTFNYALLWLFYIVFGVLLYFWFNDQKKIKDSQEAYEI